MDRSQTKLERHRHDTVFALSENNVDLILGGQGRWPELDYGVKISSFQSFDSLLAARNEIIFIPLNKQRCFLLTGGRDLHA